MKKSAVFFGLSLSLSGCILPEWVNPAVKRSFEASYRKGFKQESLATEDLYYDGAGDAGPIDIFSHYSVGRHGITPGIYRGIHVPDFDLATFMRSVDEFPCPENRFFGPDEMRVYWMNRGNWYFPTKEEMLEARACVIQAYIRLVEMAEGSNEAQQYALGMSELARVVFANVAELGLRTPAIDRPDLDSRPGLVNFFRSRPELLALVDRVAAVAPADEEADLQAAIDLLTSKPLDAVGMIHASDFLDHHGQKASSLKVWKALIEQGDDRLLMEQLRNSPYVAKYTKQAHFQRITFYNRGMGSAAAEWAQNTGWVIRYLWNNTGAEGKEAMRSCMPDTLADRANMELAYAYNTRELFYHLDNNQDEIIPLYKCIITEMFDKQGGLTLPVPEELDETFISLVPVLLHMIKISHDGLAVLLGL